MHYLQKSLIFSFFIFACFSAFADEVGLQNIEVNLDTNITAGDARPDGEIITVQLNSHLIRDKDGNPKEVEGTILLIED